jgi:hypothetical protein
MRMDDRDLPNPYDRIQEYLDDTLPRREAVRFFLQVQKDPRLKAELESYREIYSALDTTPKAAPAPGFDARVLTHVPIERYRSAPRHAERVLVIGDVGPSLGQRLVHPLRRGMTAVVAAYVLFLVVSHSFLAQSAADLAARLGGSLESLAARTQQVPVLSGVAKATLRVYDAIVQGLASLGGVLGVGVLTVLVGLAVGATVLGIYHGARRRSAARRTHV